MLSQLQLFGKLQANRVSSFGVYRPTVLFRTDLPFLQLIQINLHADLATNPNPRTSQSLLAGLFWCIGLIGCAYSAVVMAMAVYSYVYGVVQFIFAVKAAAAGK